MTTAPWTPGDGLEAEVALDYGSSRDAAHECVHGRLAYDVSDPCGCWPQEVGRRRHGSPAPAFTEAEIRQVATGVPTLDVEVAGDIHVISEPDVVLDPSSFVGRAVARIDTELARLDKARERLVALARKEQA